LVIELVDCLHTPEAPVNLISMGAMLENGFTFQMKSSHVEVYPVDHQSYAVADIVSPFSIAMPVFVPRIPNGSLFHEHLGHPGVDLTNAILSGNSVVGLEDWNGTKMRGVCDSCLKGKHP
ncbi:hypothetical protein F5880DRAFT_1450833, partial [Lentinula raphanica]